MTSPTNLIAISDHSFDERVTQSQWPWLLAFCADGCAASQRLLALLAGAAPCCDGGVAIAKASPTESPELAARFGIGSVPSLLLLRGGTVYYQFVGELSRRELDELLARACADGPSLDWLNPTSAFSTPAITKP
jgi:thioredoxin-like negative regulator of GroEL